MILRLSIAVLAFIILTCVAIWTFPAKELAPVEYSVEPKSAESPSKAIAIDPYEVALKREQERKKTAKSIGYGVPK